MSEDAGYSGEIILYHTEDGESLVQMRAVGDTVWMTAQQIGTLFSSSVPNITVHIKNIFDDAELDRESTIKDYLIVREEGSRTVQRSVTHYNLDLVLAVAYRVRTPRGAQFRRWATTVLKEYLVKGFAMDDARLKEPGGLDYFDELLERIRDIRASEKRFYQKVRDLFTTASDYDPDSSVAKDFYATVQNKITYSVTGQTSAELILARSQQDLPNMGLTSWKGPKVRKGDIVIAKNYLSESEVKQLNRLVDGLLTTAEDRAEQRKQTTMREWSAFVDSYITFTGRDVLQGRGSVSRATMEREVGQRYGTFDAERKRLEAVEADRLDELASRARSAQVGEHP